MKEKYSLTNKDLSMQRAVKYTHEKNCKYPVEKRIEVITKQLALGNMRLVADLTGVSYGLIRIWKGQPWWKEMELEIRNSRKARVDDKLNKIIDKALDTIEDRLDKGDFVYDQKKGEISRKPVSLKEARGAANDLMQRQIAVEKLAQEEKHLTNTSTIKDQLADLALQFAAFNTTRTLEVVPNAVHEERETRLQTGERAVQQSPGTEEGQSGTQHSTSLDGRRWESGEGGREGRGSQEASEQGWDELDDEFADSDAEAESLLQQNPEWEFEESEE
jgi:hypothetical protein